MILPDIYYFHLIDGMKRRLGRYVKIFYRIEAWGQGKRKRLFLKTYNRMHRIIDVISSFLASPVGMELD
jgi:hypothetical protein